MGNHCRCLSKEAHEEVVLSLTTEAGRPGKPEAFPQKGTKNFDEVGQIQDFFFLIKKTWWQIK